MVVSDGDTRILIDAGITCKQMTDRLEVLGIAPKKLSGICLTHDHVDHIKGVSTFCKNYGTPLYASLGTRDAAIYRLRDLDDAKWFEFAPGDGVGIGALSLMSFAVPHDAGDPVGFTIRGDGRCLGIATDLGYIPAMVERHLKACHALVLESNHDVEMLMRSDYPWQNKERIKGRHGHLSNTQCTDTLENILPGVLSTLVLAHISENTNTPTLAQNNAKKLLNRFGVAERVALHVASPDATGWLKV